MQRIHRNNGDAASQNRRACEEFQIESSVRYRWFRNNGANSVTCRRAAQAEHVTHAFWCLSAW
jgi:hypothetical protein